MLSVLDMVRQRIAPTKTYALREIVWIPGSGEDGIGRLLVKQQYRDGKRHNYEYDLDSYAVNRDTPEPHDNGGTAFWLHNITDPEQEQPYRCVVGGLTPKCNCKASRCDVRDEAGELTCKHICSLSFLIENGYLNA